MLRNGREALPQSADQDAIRLSISSDPHRKTCSTLARANVFFSCRHPTGLRKPLRSMGFHCAPPNALAHSESLRVRKSTVCCVTKSSAEISSWSAST